MPIIDPDGYFGGDRFDDISDSARMMWPTFFLASNTVARIELNYRKICAQAFSRWKKKPSEQQFMDWIGEYQSAYLLFIYESDGTVWGQWDTSDKFLPRHKLAADLRSPAPCARDFVDWKNEYLSKKAAKSSNTNNFKIFRKPAQTFADLRTNVRGVGVGVGIGKPSCENPVAEAPVSPVVAIDSFDQEVDLTAQRIHDRHPSVRSCGLSEIKTRLRKIVKRHANQVTPKSDVLNLVDKNHEAECASEQWTKSGGEYAKGLANWLAPTEDRYMSAKARDSPQASLYHPQGPAYEPWIDKFAHLEAGK